MSVITVNQDSIDVDLSAGCRGLTVLMVRSFSAGRSDSVTPLKAFLDSLAAVADFLHSFLSC